jgi:hypothetical protein
MSYSRRLKLRCAERYPERDLIRPVFSRKSNPRREFALPRPWSPAIWIAEIGYQVGDKLRGVIGGRS